MLCTHNGRSILWWMERSHWDQSAWFCDWTLLNPVTLFLFSSGKFHTILRALVPARHITNASVTVFLSAEPTTTSGGNQS